VKLSIKAKVKKIKEERTRKIRRKRTQSMICNANRAPNVNYNDLRLLLHDYPLDFYSPLALYSIKRFKTQGSLSH